MAKLLESLEFARLMQWADALSSGILTPPYQEYEWIKVVYGIGENFSEKSTKRYVATLTTPNSTKASFSDLFPEVHPLALHHTLYGELEVKKVHLRVWAQMINRPKEDIFALSVKYCIPKRRSEHYLSTILKVYVYLMDELEVEDVECFQEKNTFFF